MAYLIPDGFEMDFAGGCAPASEGLAGYDAWKAAEPSDSDDVYYSSWEALEVRCREARRNALAMQGRDEFGVLL